MKCARHVRGARGGPWHFVFQASSSSRRAAGSSRTLGRRRDRRGGHPIGVAPLTLGGEPRLVRRRVGRRSPGATSILASGRLARPARPALSAAARVRGDHRVGPGVPSSPERRCAMRPFARRRGPRDVRDGRRAERRADRGAVDSAGARGDAATCAGEPAVGGRRPRVLTRRADGGGGTPALARDRRATIRWRPLVRRMPFSRTVGGRSAEIVTRLGTIGEETGASRERAGVDRLLHFPSTKRSFVPAPTHVARTTPEPVCRARVSRTRALRRIRNGRYERSVTMRTSRPSGVKQTRVSRASPPRRPRARASLGSNFTAGGGKSLEGQSALRRLWRPRRAQRGDLRCVTSMAAKIAGYIKLAIEAGKAAPRPPIGPALGAKVRSRRPSRRREARTTSDRPGRGTGCRVALPGATRVDRAARTRRR